jgi:ribosome-binding factor A
MNDNSKINAQRHDQRASEEIAHEAAKWIRSEASTQSLITVTRATVADRGTHATIYVSIFPEEEIRPGLAFLTRSTRDFSLHLRTTRIRPIPQVEFLLEDGTANKPVPLDADLPAS